MSESYKRYPFEWDIPPTASSEFVDQIYSSTGAVSVRDVVYIPTGTGGVSPALNTTMAFSKVVGMAVTSAAPSTPVTIRRHGRVSGFSGLTVGADYYLDSVAGGITTTLPTAAGATIVLIGRAASSTQLDLTVQMLSRRAY